MRHEGDDDTPAGFPAQDRLHLRRMPVGRHLVSLEGLVHLAVVHREGRRTPGAAHAGFGIDDDAVRFHEPALDQRDERQQRAGGIAARVPDQPGGSDLGRIDLAQPVNGFPQELRRGMRLIGGLVHAGLVETKISRKVDRLAAPLENLGCDLHRQLVGQGRKNDVRGRADPVVVQLLADEVHPAGHGGKHPVEALPGILPGGNHRKINNGMAGEQPDEFGSGVSRCAGNGGSDHRSSPHEGGSMCAGLLSRGRGEVQPKRETTPDKPMEGRLILGK